MSTVASSGVWKIYNITTVILIIALQFANGNQLAQYVFGFPGITLNTVGPLDGVYAIDAQVSHIEQDLSKESRLIYADGGSLKMYDNGVVTTITGVSVVPVGELTYQEGTAEQARFSQITSFCQLNSTTIVMTDTKNNCIRTFNRVTGITSLLSGDCSPTSGYQNGNLSTALYSEPFKMKGESTKSIIYLTDKSNRAVRELNLITDQVDTVANLSGIGRPLGIDLGWNDATIFITTETSLLSIKTHDRTIQLLIPSFNRGFADGPLLQAKINSPQGILTLSRNVLLLMDTDNNRLRIIHLAFNSISSICTGGTGSQSSDVKISECQIAAPSTAVDVSEGEGDQDIYIGSLNRKTISVLKAFKKHPLDTDQSSQVLRVVGSKGRGRRKLCPAGETDETLESTTKAKEYNRPPSQKIDENTIITTAVLTTGVVLIVVIIGVIFLLHKRAQSKEKSKTKDKPEGNNTSNILRRTDSGEYSEIVEAHDPTQRTYSSGSTPPGKRASRYGPLPKLPGEDEFKYYYATPNTSRQVSMTCLLKEEQSQYKGDYADVYTITERDYAADADITSGLYENRCYSADNEANEHNKLSNGKSNVQPNKLPQDYGYIEFESS